MENEINNNQIFEAIKGIGEKVDSLDKKLDQKVDALDKKIDNTDKRIDEVLDVMNTFASHTEERFEKIEASMATKEDLGRLKLDMIDAMDDKLANLQGNLVVLMRKEDRKLVALIDELIKQGIISNEAAKRILSLDPFPQLSVS